MQAKPFSYIISQSANTSCTILSPISIAYTLDNNIETDLTTFTIDSNALSASYGWLDKAGPIDLHLQSNIASMSLGFNVLPTRSEIKMDSTTLSTSYGYTVNADTVDIIFSCYDASIEGQQGDHRGSSTAESIIFPRKADIQYGYQADSIPTTNVLNGLFPTCAYGNSFVATNTETFIEAHNVYPSVSNTIVAPKANISIGTEIHTVLGHMNPNCTLLQLELSTNPVLFSCSWLSLADKPQVHMTSSFVDCSYGNTIMAASATAELEVHESSIIASSGTVLTPCDAESKLKFRSIRHQILSSVEVEEIVNTDVLMLIPDIIGITRTDIEINSVTAEQQVQSQAPTIENAYELESPASAQTDCLESTLFVGSTISIPVSTVIVTNYSHSVSGEAQVHLPDDVASVSIQAYEPALDYEVVVGSALIEAVSSNPTLAIEMHVKESYGAYYEAIPTIRESANEAEVIYKLWIGAEVLPATINSESYRPSLSYYQNAYTSEAQEECLQPHRQAGSEYTTDILSVAQISLPPSLQVEMHVENEYGSTINAIEPSLHHYIIEPPIAQASSNTHAPMLQIQMHIAEILDIPVQFLKPALEIQMHVTNTPESYTDSIAPSLSYVIGVPVAESYIACSSPMLQIEMHIEHKAVSDVEAVVPSLDYIVDVPKSQCNVDTHAPMLQIEMHIAELLDIPVQLLKPSYEIQLHVGNTPESLAESIPSYIQKDNSMIVEYEPWTGGKPTTSEITVNEYEPYLWYEVNPPTAGAVNDSTEHTISYGWSIYAPTIEIDLDVSYPALEIAMEIAEKIEVSSAAQYPVLQISMNITNTPEINGLSLDPDIFSGTQMNAVIANSTSQALSPGVQIEMHAPNSVVTTETLAPEIPRTINIGIVESVSVDHSIHSYQASYTMYAETSEANAHVIVATKQLHPIIKADIALVGSDTLPKHLKIIMHVAEAHVITASGISPGIPRTISVQEISEAHASSPEQSFQYGCSVHADISQAFVVTPTPQVGLAPTLRLSEDAIASTAIEIQPVLGIGGCSISAIPAPVIASSVSPTIRFGCTVTAPVSLSTSEADPATKQVSSTITPNKIQVPIFSLDPEHQLGITISSIPSSAYESTIPAEFVMIYPFFVETAEAQVEACPPSFSTGSHLSVRALTNIDHPTWQFTIPTIYDGKKWAKIGYDYYVKDFVWIGHLDPVYDNGLLIGHKIK